jgi:hypothetical protein
MYPSEKTDRRAGRLASIMRRLRGLAFSLVIFVAFLGALEIILRTTHLAGARPSWVQADPLLGWRNVPGAAYWERKENPHPIEGRINSYGWRDKEWSIKKAPGVYRIAILGDSLVEAIQVEQEKTFLSLAEQRLNRGRGRKVELMNFARASACPTEELLILKHDVRKFSPDMVVEFFFPGNDIEDSCRETTVYKTRPFYTISESGKLKLDTSFTRSSEYRLKDLIGWPRQHSALVCLITDRINAMRRSEAEQKASTPKEGYLTLCTAKPDPKFVRNYRLCKALFRAMADECRARGARFMLVTLPNASYVPQVDHDYLAMDRTFDGNFFEDDLKEFAASLGIEYMGLQRVFRKTCEERGHPLAWAGWGHWNYEGHELAGRALAAKLGSILNPAGQPRTNH